MGALDAIADRVRVCTLCPLHKTRTHAVPGEGGGKVFLVGEAPGRHEDESGRPFCGAAGKNLDLGLAAAGLSRDDVFVTSIVKCRPPKNRDPRTHEKDACRPFLVAQVGQIAPAAIVALGRHGLSGVLGEAGGGLANFSDRAGTFCGNYGGAPVWASLHPAAILYRRAWRDKYLDDWRRFGDWWRSR